LFCLDFSSIFLLIPLEDTIEGAIVLGAPHFPTLNDAINDWVALGRPNTVITILDNRSYALNSPLELADGSCLVIQAGALTFCLLAENSR